MSDIEAINDYIKKIQKRVRYNSDFHIAGKYLIKKTVIEDLLCCVFAKLPDYYVRLLRSNNKRFASIGMYLHLQNVLKKTCWWSSSSYFIKLSELDEVAKQFLINLPKDLKKIESELS